MSEVSPRPRWRDGLLLAVLAAVILGGLVHYGRGLGDDADEPAATGPQRPTAATSPTAEATAQLEGSPPTDPAAPAAPTGGTCWDGRETSSLRLCGLPEGARGLAWVFPSFSDDRALCHKARPNDDNYPVVESYECFQHALGKPVTITYDHVKDPQQVEDWLLARVGPRNRHDLPGAHGGRCVFVDGVSRPARITGMYEQFPYAVSVYAASPQAAKIAWKKLVRQRPPENVRGIRNS
jgi:hypothetical protein